MFIWVVGGAHEPYQPRPVPPRSGVRPVARTAKVGAAGQRQEAPGADDASTGPPPSPGNAYERAAQPAPEARPAVVARQIMSTPVASVGPQVSSNELARLIHEKGYHHAPVLSARGALLGMVSDHDLLRAREDQNVAVGELMSTRVLTASPDTTIRELARVMVVERVGSVPILDQYETLVGIVTRSDVLRCVVNHAPLDLWVR